MKHVPKRALVAGATGYLGGHVADALHAQGWIVRALARNPERLGEHSDSFDEIAVGDVTATETLRDAMDNVDLVFSSVGLRSFKRKPTVWEVDWQGNRNLVDAAIEAKVPRFVFISVFHSPDLRSTVGVVDARERVVDHLANSPLNWAVIRPTGFFNDMDEFFSMAQSGRVWLIGSGTTTINPIHAADIADRVAALVKGDFDTGTSIDIGGPDTFQQREIGQVAFDVLEQKPRFSKVPVWIIKLLFSLAKPFNQNLWALGGLFAAMGDHNAVAPAIGTHHLADHFRRNAAKA